MNSRPNMPKNYISMILWTLSVNCVWSNLVVEFSRSLNGADILTTIQGVSMEICKQECEERERCTHVVYHRQPSYCVLTSASRNVQQITSVGAVLSYYKNGPIYGGNIHSPSETCKRNTEGTTTCGVEECGVPKSISAAVSGNLYSVGNQLVLDCGAGSRKITCGQDGVWIHDTTHVDCGDPCGVTGLYNAHQQQLYCDMYNDGAHWMVFQRRYDGSIDFFRNWTDYRDGFGGPNEEFWLGLEQIHQTVSKGVYELRIDMEDFEGNERFAKYDTFKIHGEEDSYRLVVKGWSGDCGDSLHIHSGMMFSTLDRDNDRASYSCAQRFEGTWWYKYCHLSNLNGLYINGGHTPDYATHIHWLTWRGYYYSLRKTEMKMRRKYTNLF